MLLTAILLQAAAQAPDIEFRASVTARDGVVRRQGEARLEVRAEPDAGSTVETERAPETRGEARLRNLRAGVHARARIADARRSDERQETSASDPR
jgi:uncharacterized protein (DUF58 family)